MLETPRLILRRWREEDLHPFAKLNADARVCAFLTGTLTSEESNEAVKRIEAHFEREGFGLWALEIKGGPRFIGYTGLLRPSFAAHFTPCVEIGWRLAFEFWGQGYATEAARRALRDGFETLGLAEIVAFTVPDNRRSRAVMERLGMIHDPKDDFEHPGLPEGHRLRRHVLYRASQSSFGRKPESSFTLQNPQAGPRPSPG